MVIHLFCPEMFFEFHARVRKERREIIIIIILQFSPMYLLFSYNSFTIFTHVFIIS